MKNKKVDYHIHGEFSGDSKQDYELLIKKAIAQNYSAIAFTEHFDLIPLEIFRFGLLPFDLYHKKLSDLKKKYPQINISIGLEIGEIHRSKNLLDNIMKFAKPYLIIGSIHILPDNSGVSLPWENDISDEKIQIYYEENLKLVKNGGFDILGHLGIFRRYQTNPFNDDKFRLLIRDIFKTIIEKDIALEVNYSSLRKPLNNVIPEPEHLKLYKEMGGKLITIGSDAHKLAEFDDNYDATIKILQSAGFEYINVKRDKGWEKIDI